MTACTLPPPGWRCSRKAPHDGPCAAYPEPPEFREFPSISRYSTAMMTITEKIDGSNVQIVVPDDPSEPLRTGSRTRWITPEKDMIGFAAFVQANAEMFRRLGPGRHFGEWWGKKIQRNYGLDHNRLSLFNVHRFSGGLSEGLPDNVALVPVLYHGPVDTRVINKVIADLYTNGSRAMPGFMQPEGVVIQFPGATWKVTDHGDAKKGREHHLRALMDQAEPGKSPGDGRDIIRIYDDAGGDWIGDAGSERALAEQVLEFNMKLRDERRKKEQV